MLQSIRKFIDNLVPKPDPSKRYSYHHLEAAVCLWEAILYLERTDHVTARLKIDRKVDRILSEQIEEVRLLHGAKGLRRFALSWVDALQRDWIIADTKNGQFPEGGQYGESFDWDFVPGWIVNNVDWSDPNEPHLKG